MNTNTVPVDWNKWLTFIAALTLVAAVIIPFTQKKYEEWKAKTSFNLYLKKFFGVLFNALTYDKIEYALPSVSNNPEKQKLLLGDYMFEFEKDLKLNQSTNQYRVAFAIVYNLQNLFLVVNHIQNIIRQIDSNKLYEQTLSYGKNLTKKELNKIYGILLLIEHYSSITKFHDRFSSMLSIQRIIKDGQWIGLKLDQSLLGNQKIIIDDLKHINNEINSLQEVVIATKLLIQELKSFYEFDKLMKKKQ